MGGLLWQLTCIAAIVVFIVAISQNKGFWNAARMGAGVLVLGLMSIIALGVGAVVVGVAFHLLMLALWVGVIALIISVAVKAVKGTP